MQVSGFLQKAVVLNISVLFLKKNGQTSFKKRQHPFTVLSGQLIINFRKVKKPGSILKTHLGMDITENCNADY